MSQVADRLATLLRETGSAHHQAFAQVNGEDAEWAAWYAHYLLPKLGAHLRALPEEPQLNADLARFEQDRERESQPADWPSYYARRLLAQYGSR